MNLVGIQAQVLESFQRRLLGFMGAAKRVGPRKEQNPWQALVEANISRFNQITGDGLQFRTDRRRATEIAIAVDALNRILELGNPEYARLPYGQSRWPSRGRLAAHATQSG